MKIKKCVVYNIMYYNKTCYNNFKFKLIDIHKRFKFKKFKTLAHVYQTILKLKYFINYPARDTRDT